MRLLAVLLLLVPVLVWPAGSIVQTGYNTDTSGVAHTTLSVTLTGVTAGNTIIVDVGWGDSGGGITTTVSDGTSYSATPKGKVRNATNGYSSEVFYLENVSSGSHTITATFCCGGSIFMEIRADEISGTATSSSIDKDAGQSQDSPGTGTDGISSTATAATTNANDFVMGFTVDATLDNDGTLSAGTGYTIGSGSNLQAIGHEYKNVSSTGTQTATFTNTTNRARITFVVAIKQIPAPTFSVAPAIGTRTTSSIPITATTACTDCTFYGVAETSGLGTPTCTQIKAGQGADGNAAYKSANVAMTASVQGTITFSSYTDGTVRDGYFCLHSTANGDSSVASIASMYKIPAFTTALTVASTSATAYTSNSKVLDGAGSVYWVRCQAGASAPSVAQVEAQTGGCITDSSSGSATGAQTLTLATSPQPPYSDLYYVGTYGSQHEAAVHALTSQCLSAPANFQFVNCPTGLTSVTATGSIPAVFNATNYKNVTTTGVSGTFASTHIITDSTSGAWGVVAYVSGSLVIVDVRSGTFAASDSIYDSGGATGTVSGSPTSYTPIISTGDVLEEPTTVSPSSAALSFDSTGEASYTASGRQTATGGKFYDISVPGYGTLGIDLYFNNSVPQAGSPPTLVLKTGVAMANFNLNSVFTDTDGETLAFGLISGAIPAGLSINYATGVISGTPTVENEAGVALGIVAIDGATATASLTVTLFPITSWTLGNYTNLTQAAATSQVNSLTHSTVTISYAFASSMTVAAGSVISQSPAAGMEIAPGDTETLTISLGPTTVTVPNCLNTTVGQCTLLLSTASLFATLMPGIGCTDPTSTIYSQGPAYNDTAAYNFTLTVYCR